MQIFRLVTAHIKIYQIRPVIFGTKSQFFFKLFIQNFIRFREKEPIKVQIIRLSTAHMNLNFASPFSVMTQNSSEIFYLNYYALDKKSPSKYKFSDFRVL